MLRFRYNLLTVCYPLFNVAEHQHQYDFSLEIIWLL